MGFCCIQYQVCPDQAGAGNPGFSVSTKAGGKVGVGKGSQDDSCASVDYIGIQASGNGWPKSAILHSLSLTGPLCTTTVGATDSRYCGPFLTNTRGGTVNAPICGRCSCTVFRLLATHFPAQIVRGPSQWKSSRTASAIQWPRRKAARPMPLNQEASAWNTLKFLVSQNE